MAVKTFSCGKLSDGRSAEAFLIENEFASVTLLDFGAAVQSLIVPDRNGNPVDVVLGYDTPAEYEKNNGFLGATIGRVANRIGGAAFSLGGKTYQLAANDGENHLHGGFSGFDRRFWLGKASGDHTVTFTRLSPDDEEGYPGNLSVKVSYSLSGKALKIVYEAETDRETPVNLTNHSYFNLNGGGSILDHLLELRAERFTENDSACLPTGRILSVEGTPFDFRTAKKLGRDINAECEQLRFGKGYDHNFLLSGAKRAAVLFSEKTGIRMELSTDMPGVQLYTANNLDPRKGKGGADYSFRDAVCLETQLYPNALRCYGFPSPVLHPGEKLHSETVYAFSAE